MLAGYEVFDVRCDIHPGMKAWVFVPPSKHYAVVHDPGTIRFTEIPLATMSCISGSRIAGRASTL